MKIYTKGGDNGTTFIPCEGRVNKYHCSVDAQGEIDELNCWIGMIIQAVSTKDVFLENLNYIQKDLMEIGAQLATNQQRITQEKIEWLEKGIDQMTENLKPLTNFILPRWPAEIHVARAVCRRAERTISLWISEASKVTKTSFGENQSSYLDLDKFNLILPYLNRLSDYLFTLSRHVNKDDKIWSS